MPTPLLGICAGIETGPIIERAGAAFLEVSVQRFLIPGEPEASFAPHLQAASNLGCPIRCANVFLPANLPCVGEAVDEPALLAYAETAFARAAQVGIKRIAFGSGKAREIPVGYSQTRARDQFIGFLKTIAPAAARAEVIIVIEPLNVKECNFINTLSEGAGIVEECGHPNIGLLADTYHMGSAQEGPETLRRFGEYLRHVHVAEYPSRKFPGADGQSYRAYFAALREIGYRDDISIECQWGNLAEDAVQAIANIPRDLLAAGYPAA
jgi:sugar phosphate isomerase/epimerase